MNIKIQTIDGAAVPAYAHEGDAACDLRAACDCYLEPGEWHVVPTGIKLALPDGYAALVLPRSGLATKQGVTVINSPGLIDSGYRGEIGAPLYNANRTVGREVRKGDRIAQLLIVPVVHAEFDQVDELDETERGKGGFGSTGME